MKIRTYHHQEFQPAALAEAKAGRSVSLCLPARDEEATVGDIVLRVRQELVARVPLVDEVLVIDDRSTDSTADAAARAGARVVRVDDVLPEHSGHGKGHALWKATAAAEGDLIVFCDADVRDFDPRFVVGLLGPLLADDGVALVKAFYERPLDGQPRGGGRVTELVARPVIALLFPALSSIVQPLAGECASRREVLEQLPFVDGYGVDLGLLIDVAATFGTAAVAQVDLGVRVHRNRPLHELAPMATVVLQTALRRAGVAAADVAELSVPGVGPVTVQMAEHPPLVSVPRTAPDLRSPAVRRGSQRPR